MQGPQDEEEGAGGRPLRPHIRGGCQGFWGRGGGVSRAVAVAPLTYRHPSRGRCPARTPPPRGSRTAAARSAPAASSRSARPRSSRWGPPGAPAGTPAAGEPTTAAGAAAPLSALSTAGGRGGRSVSSRSGRRARPSSVATPPRFPQLAPAHTLLFHPRACNPGEVSGCQFPPFHGRFTHSIYLSGLPATGRQDTGPVSPLGDPSFSGQIMQLWGCHRGKDRKWWEPRGSGRPNPAWGVWT